MKWIILIGLGLTCLVCMGAAYKHLDRKVTRYELPKGELKWSDVRPKDAKMCIPAAFTHTDGKIMGSYRYQGKTYQPNSNMRMKVSLKGEIFYISREWMSDNGFQQLTLVYNSRAIKFKDQRRAIRRALCKDKNGAFILESNYPMTMTEFALECSKLSTDAAYLDMGEFGYGYIRTGRFVRPLYTLGYFTRNKQTNWIYIE